MKFKTVIALIITFLIVIYIVPIITHQIYKWGFKDTYVNIEDSVKQEIVLKEAKSNKVEGYMHFERLKENSNNSNNVKYLEVQLFDKNKNSTGTIYVDIDKEIVEGKTLEKTYYIPNVRYGYVSKIDKLPESMVIDAIVKVEENINKASKHAPKIIDIIGLNFESIKMDFNNMTQNQNGVIKDNVSGSIKETIINLIKLPSEIVNEITGLNIPPGALTILALIL